MSSLEDMKEIAKRLMFGLRQSLQLIDPTSFPRRQTPVQKRLIGLTSQQRRHICSKDSETAFQRLPLTTKHYPDIHESIEMLREHNRNVLVIVGHNVIKCDKRWDRFSVQIIR